jgi:hypothetical protein
MAPASNLFKKKRLLNLFRILFLPKFSICQKIKKSIAGHSWNPGYSEQRLERPWFKVSLGKKLVRPSSQQGSQA